MGSEIRKKFINASLWSGAISYFYFAFNFLCQVVFARTLTPKLIGVFALGLAIRELTGMFCSIAIPGSYIKSSGDQANFDAYISITVAVEVIQLIACFIIAGVYFFFRHNAVLAMTIILLSISQCLIFSSYVYMAVLEKKLEYKPIAVVQGIGNLLAGIIAVGIAMYFHSIFALIAKDILSAAYILFFIRKTAGMRYSFVIDKKTIYEQLSFGIKCVFYRIAEVAQYRVPEVLISTILGKAALGFFYQSRYLAYFPIKLFQPFTNSILFSYLEKHKSSLTELDKNFWWINYVISRLLLPIVVIIYLFGSFILTYLYGAKWQTAGICFSYLSIFIFSGTLFSVANNLASLIGKQMYITFAYLSSLAVFVLIVFYVHSIAGATLAFSVCTLGGLFVLHSCLTLKGHVSGQIKIFYPTVLIGAVFVASHYLRFTLFVNVCILATVFLILGFVERRYLYRLSKEIMSQYSSAKVDC